MSSEVSIADLRREYVTRGLRKADLNPDPVEQFRTWFSEAQHAGLLEPNAMSLSTADAKGRVYSRTVLLKAFDSRGFVFYTNFNSAKAGQIAENPHAALLFPWLALERQVSISGRVEKVSTAESLRYFISRPIGNKIGAWVSQQSAIISSRRILESKFEELMHKFSNGEVPLPDFWGGFRIVPDQIEFWQGAASRLHDRFLYTRPESGGAEWQIERLSP